MVMPVFVALVAGIHISMLCKAATGVKQVRA
jgi:hypothetical protein